jgi:perosamine synthetase
MLEQFVALVRDMYQTHDFIPLHEPRFGGNEKNYLTECIDSTFVSSVGKFVDAFEVSVANYTGAKHAVATVNGTTALHIALLLAKVGREDEVITQSLTFVATANAIAYLGAHPLFVDVEESQCGMSADSLEAFLNAHADIDDSGVCRNKTSGRAIRACVPMHTFGHPVEIDRISEICQRYHIPVVEDAAESLGSFYQDRHTGTAGKMGVLSFNGNKIITTGGGGMIITDDTQLAQRAKHLTTTAKQPHRWEFYHDEIGYNYRLPNINAALGVAQVEQLPIFIEQKRVRAQQYLAWGEEHGVTFVHEPAQAKSNYWLNAIKTKNRAARDTFLNYTNDHGIMTRPIWTPMHQLPMYQQCQCAPLANTQHLSDTIVNIPSTP